ncbi:MAG TPA: peptidoglycan DD-metalloendopeptidase family protein [Allosphingosinicella sp.]|nr:peptidoglycan DD-metalloendopeptidase family protein [Allosphingosinicella sp.]
MRAPLAPPVVHSKPAARRGLAQLQLITDLGQNIGSLEWFRGFALCAALCYAAYSFAPGVQPFVGASPAPMADAQWEEARSLSISPLAYGADTGRRMAATDAVEALSDTPERPTIERLAALGPGDGFSQALRRAGVGPSDASQVADLVGHVVPIADIAPGTTASLTLGRRASKKMARPLDALSFRARFDLKLEIQRVGGHLVINQLPIAVDNTPLRLQGRAGPSLYRAARAAGVPVRAVESFIRALATQIDVGHIAPDDRFDMIIEHRRAATGETETGRLLYAGLDRARAKDLQLVEWQQDGKAQWFEASGVGKPSGMFQRPVPGTVTSNFGSRRHPILGYTRMHKGMDFRAGYGTPILAASDGRIARAGWAGGYGRQVMINHAQGYATSYSHMSRIAIQPGQYVRRGQLIGYVGSTGLSTGPHLHYELHKNGRAINPSSVRYASQALLRGPELASFRNRLRRLLSVPLGGVSAAEARAAKAEAVEHRARRG